MKRGIRMEPINFLERPDNSRIQSLAKQYNYEVDADAVRLYLELQWTFREVEKKYNHLLEAFGLSESRFVILMFLGRATEKQLLSSEIADKLGVTRATTSKLLKGMEQHKLIQKIASQVDKRSTHIQLTDKGDQLLTSFLPYNYASAHLLFKNFTETEKEQFSLLLKKLGKNKENLQLLEDEINGNKKN